MSISQLEILTCTTHFDTKVFFNWSVKYGFEDLKQDGDMLGCSCFNMASGLRKNMSISQLEILTCTTNFDPKVFFNWSMKYDFDDFNQGGDM